MSEKNEASGQSSEGSANTEGKNSVSYESHVKLLGEKKTLQQRLNDAETRLAEIEQAKLEAEGKVKEALENQKKLTEEYKKKNVTIVKSVAEKTIRSQFLREAEKLGCVDPELAMKACSFDDLEITDDFEFDNQKLVEKIQNLTKEKPFMFKKDFKLPQDLTPSKKESEVPLEKMTPEQLKERYKKLISGSAQ